MKRRVLYFSTMILLFACALGVGVLADATSERYHVGYAIKDINPYIYSENLGMGVKDLGDLALNADWTVEVSVQHPSTGKTTLERMIRVPLSGYANSAERPSGGIMDDNGDGFTGIGDGLHITCTTVTDSEGTTLVYFGLDAISGYSNLLTDVANGISAALDGAVTKDHVFVNGSHTHEGADFGTAKKTINENSSAGDILWRAYYDYTVQRMVDAAVECYNGRTEAVMTKGSIDASESSGYQLNFVRQYKVEEYVGYGNGNYSMFPQSTYIFGSNFGARTTASQTATLKKTVVHVSQADDTMHILQFTPVNGDFPIVFVNWRAHATMMSSYAGGGTGAIISSDYIGSFRYEMEKAGYRMMFLQGAAGNVVATSTLGTPWQKDMPNSEANHVIYYGGTMLTNVALDCLKNTMTEELTPGPIRSVCAKLDLEMQVDPPGLVAAATYYQNAGLTSSNYKYIWPESEGGDGKTYILNSKHHARNVVSRSKANPNTFADMTVNAFVLGKAVAFVTAPTEMFDRYSADATLKDTTDNDWDDLFVEGAFGTPFVMAYTNGHNGYTANQLSYSYNQGSVKYGVGSYEANSSRNAAGEGEKIIDEYERLLAVVAEGYVERRCPSCNKSVVWTPLLRGTMSSGYTLATGHYYLYEDVPMPASRNSCSLSSGTVCLDLNGKVLQTNSRAFSLTGTATLSIMDLASGGVIESYDSNNSVGGGVISTSGKVTVNLYSGTLRMVTGENAYVSKGGIIAVNGTTFNMYGGVLDASRCALVKDFGNHVSGNTDGCAAAIALYPNSTLNISGGRVIAGKAEPEEGRADCIFVQSSSSKFTLSGDAQIDEIYFDTTCSKYFKIDSSFTGSATLRFNPNVSLYDNLDIGELIGESYPTDGKLTCFNTGCTVSFDKHNLVLLTEVAADDDNSYKSLQDAFDLAKGKLISLRKDVTSDVTVTEDAYLDLNGFNITGNINVSSGKTLYCKDSATDDYTVSNGKYGKLLSVDGSVAGIPEESELAEDGYIKVTDTSGISFHRVNLQITEMTLRPAEAGVYYKSTFACDQIAAKLVGKFGIAMSIKSEPSLDNLERDCVLSDLEGFKSGGVNTKLVGTLLTGVLKTDNSADVNQANANLPVWGRAYIQLLDGSYMFGKSANRSFRNQVELIDAALNDLDAAQQSALVDMCVTYKNVMDFWDIPEILALVQNEN